MKSNDYALPWQSPSCAVLPYSISCTYPPVLWLYETNKENLQLTVLIGKKIVIFFFLEAINGNIQSP